MEPRAAVRSHLYVPGDRPELFARALQRGADALILDLEDAVAWPRKQRAREAVAEFVAGHAVSDDPTQLWVRVNAESWRDDVTAVVAPGLSGLCLAKTPGAAYVAAVAALLDELEDARGLDVGAVALSPLLEDAAAVLAAPAIAAASRVARLQVGEVDLAADCGIEPGADGAELAWVRGQVVLASAAARIEAPVGPVTTDFTDLDALRSSTDALRRMGYGSRACIHPAQVTVVNDVFTPRPDEIDRAREIVDRFERAEQAGDGVLLDADGRMIDLAVVRNARRVLARAGS
ncbi:HpcH/HpaI aldolase/citrate lyase family protein [Nocardioides soli]|uniref:Citrate lyase subunit beta/citryl-CoA lyase n=1 Tax=Nocardioides soli TaxID=1036020 RepID=A0A7W4VTU7_9ACTN|nr:CoA ester lyase [Nocardioides soli]MBB3041535.1 citrate lyase subunit beta/citryl-CoA lyase [Nocardioides soli]